MPPSQCISLLSPVSLMLSSAYLPRCLKEKGVLLLEHMEGKKNCHFCLLIHVFSVYSHFVYAVEYNNIIMAVPCHYPEIIGYAEGNTIRA